MTAADAFHSSGICNICFGMPLFALQSHLAANLCIAIVFASWFSKHYLTDTLNATNVSNENWFFYQAQQQNNQFNYHFVARNYPINHIRFTSQNFFVGILLSSSLRQFFSLLFAIFFSLKKKNRVCWPSASFNSSIAS